MASDRRRALVVAGWAFAAGSAIHITDHLRRGSASVTETLSRAGTLALVVQVVVATLVVTRHRLAPLVAAAAGIPLAIGFFAAHWLPHWSSLSDPVWKIDSAPWFSFVASTGEIVAALVLGALGTSIVRREGLASFAPRPPHPA